MPPLLTRPRLARVMTIVVLAVAQVAVSVLAAGTLAAVFARLAARLALPTLDLAVLGGCGLVLAIIDVLRRVSTEALGLDYAREVRMGLVDALLRRGWQARPERNHARIMLPFVGDLTALRQWVSDGLARGASAGLIAFGMTLWVCVAHPWFGVPLVAVVLANLAGLWMVSRPLARAIKVQRRQRGVMTSWIFNRVERALAVSSTGNHRREMNDLKRRLERFRRVSMRRAFLTGLLRAVTVISSHGMVVVVVAVSWGLVVDHRMRVHAVVGLLSLVGLINASLADLARSAELGVQGTIALERLSHHLSEARRLAMPILSRPILSRPILSRLGVEGERAGGRRAVSRSRKRLTLNDVRLYAGQAAFSGTTGDGDIVGIDSPDEASCNHLLAVLAGVSCGQGGTVQLSGRDVRSLSQRQRRRDVGLSAAWAPLLPGTLGEAISYRGRGDTTRCHARDLAADFAMGDLDMITRDASPSVLEVARLIRAMAGRPRLLILDRAGDGLDATQTSVLIEHVSHWPGVVILGAPCEALRPYVTRWWHLTARGVQEGAPGARDAEIIPLKPARKVVPHAS